MAGGAHKHYHDELLCSKELAETYFSRPDSPGIDECLGFPLRVLHQLFAKGQLKPGKALDFSAGCSVYQLISLSNVCKEIYMIRLKDSSIDHINLWLKKDGQATDWSYAFTQACNLEGNKQGCGEKEDQLRKAIKGMYKWKNQSKVDPSAVPEVDCVISLFILPMISKTKEEFQNNMKEITARLKVGGKFVLFVTLHMTYYQVGEHRYQSLKLDEKDVQDMLVNGGFTIEKTDSTGKAEAHDVADYTHKYYVLARKERDV
ncbi:indolethylamine N-methyltransferase-like [Gastrophryne carolinensis]